MSDAVVPWDQFSSDPRRDPNAALRASDMDRSVALDALATAYGDGRLDREEYDERSDAIQGSKLLGELVAPLRDLAPEPGSKALTLSSSADLDRQAKEKYVQERQGAFATFLGPSLVCWVIWAVAGFGFPWPLFVSLGTIVRVAQVLVQKQAIIASARRKIEKQELRRIEERPR